MKKQILWCNEIVIINTAHVSTVQTTIVAINRGHSGDNIILSLIKISNKEGVSSGEENKLHNDTKIRDKEALSKEAYRHPKFSFFLYYYKKKKPKRVKFIHISM